MQCWQQNKGSCLGPIARLQLGACQCHSEAAARLYSPLIISCIVHASSHYIINNKDTNWTTNTATFICTPRHGGSAEPALPMARWRMRLVSEKEKRNSLGIHVHSWIIAPRVRPAISGSSCRKPVHIKGSGESRIRQMIVNTRNQTTLFPGSMF